MLREVKRLVQDQQRWILTGDYRAHQPPYCLPRGLFFGMEDAATLIISLSKGYLQKEYICQLRSFCPL